MGRGRRSSTSRSGISPQDGPSARLGGEFSPAVTIDPGEVSIWLPELGIYGRGEDFESAKTDLLDETRTYAAQFRASEALQRASNRRHHERLVGLVEAADAEGELEQILFAEPAPVG